MKIALEALRPIWKTNPTTLDFMPDDIGFCKSLIVIEHLLYLGGAILLPSPTFARAGDGAVMASTPCGTATSASGSFNTQESL